MGFELLTQADMILNQCGRPTPPAGVKFVDLPRVLSYSVSFPGGEGVTQLNPTSQKLQNKANTLLLIDGVGAEGNSAWRIKWPSGRALSQQPVGRNAFGAGVVEGRGANQNHLEVSEPVPAEGRITIEAFGPLSSSVLLTLTGRLRYLVVDAGPKRGSVQRILGFPPIAKDSLGPYSMMDNPVRALQDLRQYPSCVPNGNILAPEWMLGNQCTPETPEGYEDESFSFCSKPITVNPSTGSIGNDVVVPGNDLVVLRRYRPLITWPVDGDGMPTFSIRTPSGYSVTGGDLCAVDGGQIWFYLFPELVVNAGDRLVIDMGNQFGTTGSSLTTVWEFEGVKRKKKL